LACIWRLICGIGLAPWKNNKNGAGVRVASRGSRAPGERPPYGISDGGVKRRPGTYKIQMLALEDLDGRCRGAKAANQLRAELFADLGGEQNLSAAQREIVKHASIVGAILSDVEAKWLVGKGADLATMGMLIDRQRRLFECLGLHNGRRPKDVTPVQSLNRRFKSEVQQGSIDGMAE
jgi:hypothetical protein